MGDTDEAWAELMKTHERIAAEMAARAPTWREWKLRQLAEVFFGAKQTLLALGRFISPWS
jgi:hypothetical protein